MGAFGTGFLGSIGDAVHQKAALARANEQKQKDMEAQYHWEALKARLAQGGTVNPDTKEFVPFSPEQRDSLVKDATDNMAKAYGGSKPVKELMQHAQQLIGKATNHPLWGHPGSENMQKDATPAAAATPAASQASATGIPAPPGLQAQAAAPALDSSSTSDAAPTNMLGSASASDAAPAVSSPTSALASASQGLSDGKSASSVDLSGASSGPSDVDQSQNQQVAPQASSDTTAVARGTTLSPPPSSKAATAATAPQGLSPAAAATPSPGPAAGIAPPPGVPPAAAGVASWNPTGHQLMNSFISPYDTARLQAESQNAIDLRSKQAIFDQQQAQLQTHLANLAKLKEAPLTPTETMLAAGVKLPAAMFTPKYDPKVVLGSQVLANSQTADGSPFNPAQTYHQILQNSNGGGVYQPVTMPYQKAVIGNLYHAINPYTHEDLGAISQEPVKLGTSSASVPSVRYLDASGNWQVSQGSRSTNPQTGNAPLAPSVNAPIPPPPTPLDPSAPATVAAAAAAAQPKSAKGRTASAAGTAPATAANRAGGKMPGGITLPPGAIPAQQLAQQQNRNTAINVAGQGLTQFTTPQEDGMSNLDIFKDPAAVDRIANYMSLADNKLEGDWDEAEKGGSTGILKFYAGLPQAYTSIQIGAIKDAYDKLTPRDKRFVADFTSLMGQWGGARKGTGASASLYNFKNMSKEIPNPVYVKSYEDAVSRAGNMFNELNQMGQHNGAAQVYDKDKILPKTGKKGTAIAPPPGGGAQPATVYAWDEKGNRHSAAAGTPLPKGWTSVKPQ